MSTVFIHIHSNTPILNPFRLRPNLKCEGGSRQAETHPEVNLQRVESALCEWTQRGSMGAPGCAMKNSSENENYEEAGKIIYQSNLFKSMADFLILRQGLCLIERANERLNHPPLRREVLVLRQNFH